MPSPPADLADKPCERTCEGCDGQHHWQDDFELVSGDPIQVCKHCPAWRPYPDDET